MKISNLLIVSLLVMSTLILRVESLHSQSIELTPAWTVTNIAATRVKVADSVVVIATSDSVFVYEALSGTLKFAWNPGIVIDGLALEQHRDGILLSTLKLIGATVYISLRYYTYEGTLLERDSFSVKTSGLGYPISSGVLLGINAISPTGRFIVYGSKSIFDRISRNVSGAAEPANDF